MEICHPRLSEEAVENRAEEIQAALQKLERRDWQLWWQAVIVILMLTAAVVSLSLPVLLGADQSFYKFHLSQSVRGLIALVLIFNIYTLYQNYLIRRLRRELAERQIQAEVFRKLAMLDPLTGLLNRRFAEQRLVAEVARSQRKGHPLTILMLDLNDFKQINDRFGHSAGDLVLKQFAERLTKSIRGSDVAVRMGGDEFLVLLPECQLGQLQTVIARLSPLEVDLDGEKILVTFSAGWKEYERGERPEELLERADQALYLNKRVAKKVSLPVSVTP